MRIIDSIFGELEYNYIWSRNIIIDFLGKERKISLMINGDDDGIFEEEQYIAYTSFMKEWESLQEQTLQQILNYYKEKRHELGYDVEENKKYPLIESVEQLLQHINLVGIVIPYSGAYDGRECGLTFDCTWDSENGIGVCFVNEKVIEVGYQDIVM